MSETGVGRSAGLTKRRSAGDWERLVQEWKASGTLAAEFAASQGLSPRTLRWWSSELDRRSRRVPAVPSTLRFVELAPRQEGPVTAPLEVAQVPQCSGVEVVLAGRRVVRVAFGFDAGTLQRVVVALEARLC